MGLFFEHHLAHCNYLHHKPFEAVIIIIIKTNSHIDANANTTHVLPTVSSLHNFCAALCVSSHKFISWGFSEGMRVNFPNSASMRIGITA